MELRASGIMLAKCLPRSSFPQPPFLYKVVGESKQSGDSHSLWLWAHPCSAAVLTPHTAAFSASCGLVLVHSGAWELGRLLRSLL